MRFIGQFLPGFRVQGGVDAPRGFPGHVIPDTTLQSSQYPELITPGYETVPGVLAWGSYVPEVRPGWNLPLFAGAKLSQPSYWRMYLQPSFDGLRALTATFWARQQPMVPIPETSLVSPRFVQGQTFMGMPIPSAPWLE